MRFIIGRLTCVLLAMVFATLFSCSKRERMQDNIHKSKGGEPTRPSDEEHGATTSTEAIELAKKEALRLGRKLGDYRIDIEISTGGGQWEVSFNPAASLSAPGGVFYVFVDKKTGSVRVLDGM
jgi:hypothetical protein